MAYKKETLIEVAKELNEVLGLEPEIETKSNTKIKDLKESILQAGQLIDPAEDEFTDNTWAILEDLGAASRPAEEYDRKEANEKEEEDKGSEQDAELLSDYEEEYKLPLADQVQKARKLDELRAIAESNSEFKKLQKKLNDYKGLQGTRLLKAAMYEELGVESSKPQQSSNSNKTAEKAPGKKYETTILGSRKGSQAEIIDNAILSTKEPQTIEQLMEKTGFSKGRIKIHLKHLIEKKGFEIDAGDGKYKAPAK